MFALRHSIALVMALAVGLPQAVGALHLCATRGAVQAHSCCCAKRHAVGSHDSSARLELPDCCKVARQPNSGSSTLAVPDTDALPRPEHAALPVCAVTAQLSDLQLMAAIRTAPRAPPDPGTALVFVRNCVFLI